MFNKADNNNDNKITIAVLIFLNLKNKNPEKKNIIMSLYNSVCESTNVSIDNK